LLGAGVVFVSSLTAWAMPGGDLEPDSVLHTLSSGGSLMESSPPSELDGDAKAGEWFGERTIRVEAGEPKLRTPPDEFLRSPIGLGGADPSSRADPWGGLGNRPPGAISAEQLELLLAEAAFQERRARTELAEIRAMASSESTEDELLEPDSTVPSVEVRVGDHGEFERVVFDWPEAIDHDVVHLAEQVIVSFSRPGRIDLSPLQDGFGQLVMGAWAEGGELTERVVLRLSPGTNIRSFSLENNRVVIDLLGGSAPPSLAQPAPDPEQDSIQELRRALEQRDAIIANLLVRVEQLERKVVLSSGDLDRVAAGGAGSTPSVGGTPLPRPGSQSGAAAQQPPGKPASEPSAAPSAPAKPEQQPPTASQGQGGGDTNAEAKPGEFEVVEEEIDRALERTLVQTGVLLLPFGQAEIEPFFSYSREEGDVPVLFADAGRIGTGNQEVRRNEFVTGLTLRVGLPFDSQVELDLPYRYVEQSVVTPVGFGQRENEDGSGHGLGDLRVGMAKTLLRENVGWWPDLVARVSWDTDTGQTTDNDVVLGGGFNELRGSLSAIKRQDPLAFVGSVSYEKSFENDNVEPGDELGFSIGAFLAASPGTSLRLALGQSFIDNSKVDGEGINGSDRVVAMATFGASVILGPGVLLDVAADIGLTDDAPDYGARASLPIRFNLPVY
jgi:hypothetical protein